MKKLIFLPIEGCVFCRTGGRAEEIDQGHDE